MVAINQIMSNIRRLQSQLLDIQRSEKQADIVGFKITDSVTFLSGDNTVGELVFSVPKYAPFRAHFLNLYGSYRRVNLTNPRESDVTYRPVDYSQSAAFFGDDSVWQNAINLTFSLRDSRWGQAQDADCNVSACFSSRVPTLALATGGIAPFLGTTPVTAWLGALRFKKDYRLDPGTALTARISPKFSLDQQSATVRNEYRIFGVLEGHRLVWRK